MTDHRSLAEIVAEGDQRASLEALRDRLAGWIDAAKYAKDIGPLAQRLADVMEKLDALPDPARESTVDDLAAARAARRASAAATDRSAVRDVRRP